VTRTLALLLALALVAAIPRFGQRENERAAISDSDYYLDMAAVFAGERQAFHPEWSAPGHTGAHHYARPLLPFLAGWTARLVPGLGVRAAFSVIDVLAAWAVAALLALLLRAHAPALRHPWLPSALFLTGFPQVNWGYHILTDTLGIATAFGGAALAWSLLEPRGEPRRRLWLLLPALCAVQSLAYLARETAWIVAVLVAWLVVRRREVRAEAGIAGAVLAVVLLAALPWAAYLRATGVRPIAIGLDLASWIDPRYLLDFVVKSAVAFHGAWALAALGARAGGLHRLPAPLTGWALGALLYMGAGYAHNSLAGVGYPLRLTWTLFPLVLVLAALGVERIAAGRDSRRIALVVLALNAAVAVTGTLLDPGTSGLTAPALLTR
jgi:hypothetical protein